MKRTLLVLGILAAVVASVYGQNAPEERVKILPTGLPGVIKLHYAMKLEEPLRVTFFNNEHEILGTDKIAIIDAPLGISKRYDVNRIGGHDFLVEVSWRKHVLVYRVTPASDRKTFTVALEPTSNQLLVKANN